MPQKEDKWKVLFADLGRPTLRGIRKCPKCGTVNGTRGNSCKNKTCDVVFRGIGPRKKLSTEACQITNLPGCKEKLFSVRVRDRGPDYRNFVEISSSPTTGDGLDCQDLDSTSEPEIKCFVETCSKAKQEQYSCSHIQSARRCFSHSQEVHIKQSVISSLNIPQAYIEMLSHLIDELPDAAVQRVSKTSFVVRCEPSVKSFCFVHVMFIKPSKNEPNLEKKWICTCRPIKLQGRDGEISQSISPGNTQQLCFHYYACICAFASNEALSAEFEHFIPQTTSEFSAPLLSQLHLVANDGKSVGLDPTLSVEIIRENISLLESIAASDDSTLANVQGLEGVLADQIIVTNVDDSLAFGDSTVLEGLDDTEQQVCQIFSNTQNTMQLATFPPQNESRSQNPGNSSSSSTNVITNHQPDVPASLKRKKDSEFNQPALPSNTVIHNFAKLPDPTLKLSSKNPTTSRSVQSQPIPEREAPVVSDQSRFRDFEQWLAGVNDRIHATMNYQLPQTPDPLVYHIPSEYFEYLKDRLATGGKKRRLPNQTLVFQRTDRAPLGTFTKHIWKITNILHILNIFNCSIIPFKTKQYFVKTNHGDFVEWIPPRNDDEKNQRIFPVLHSTFLKCGRNHESSTKESVPFVIEWVPEIFRESKLGELSIRFEFGKTGPIHEEDGRPGWGSKFIK